MALDVNGYNNVFKAFVDFAQQNANVKKGKAVAEANIQKSPLDGRKILAVTTSQTDSVHNWTRGLNEWVANDRTRTLFRNAIIDMFGGESKIPASVQKAMILSDYGEGKPLTARRILAVKAAIDTDGTAAARSANIKLETFESKEVRAAALNMGYTKAELPKLARATHLYAQANGVSEMDAMREIAEPGTKANRLMNYGGRFLENAQNFANGLRLIDDFQNWYDDLRSVRDDLDSRNPTYADANTVSKINVSFSAIADSKSAKGMEAIVFSDIAQNSSFNLAETDKEKAFGFEHNATTRFIGRMFHKSQLGTIAGLSFAKRQAVYAALDLLRPLFKSVEELKAFNALPAEQKKTPALMVAARVLKNYDKVAALMAKGQFNARNFFKVCFPDIKHPGGCNIATLNSFNNAWGERIANDPDIGEDAELSIQMTLDSTGCTIDEVIDAYKKGKPLPTFKDYSPISYSLAEFDGTTTAGRGALGGTGGDLARPYNYAPVTDQKKFLMSAKDQYFGFTFPDGEVLRAGTGANRPNNEKIIDKIEAMCGPVHKTQANAVMFAVSQSGTMLLKDGLLAYGIHSSEHAAVNFSLSRDADTGAVTVKYSSPENLPLTFSWTATIDTDGNVTSTPMIVKKREMTREAATKFVADAAQAMNVQLSDAQSAKAVALMEKFGKNMYPKNARILAQFIVNLRLTDKSAEKDSKVVKDMADSIRNWREFDFGEHNMEEYNAALKTQANVILAENMNDARKYSADEPNIYSTMKTDSNRAVFIVNGKEIKSVNDGKGVALIAALKQALPSEKAHKAVSCLMNQDTLRLVGFPQNGIAYPAGPGQAEDVDVSKLRGADKLVNRNMNTGFYSQMIGGSNDGIYDVQVSEDGKTATVTTTYPNTMAMGAGADDAKPFGNFTVQTRMTVDLEAEVPTIIKAEVSQTFD